METVSEGLASAIPTGPLFRQYVCWSTKEQKNEFRHKYFNETRHPQGGP